jgi:single-strand DNA-binding protein
MINRVILVGRLTKDPELKSTQSNINFCNFTLAVNRQFKSENGEHDADFISCIVWRIQAENLAKYQRKGNLVGVEGRIQVRNYETDTGIKYITEVVADNIQFLESKKEEKQEHNYPKTDEQIDDTFSNDKKYDKPSVLTPNKRREEREVKSEESLPF